VEVHLRLHRPPAVATIGVGVHGTAGLHDSFLLPDHWQFHLYAYSGELSLNGQTFPIRPGHVSFVPPGVPVEFAYRGRSEHLFVHLQPVDDGPAVGVPVMQDAGDQAGVLSEMLHQALAAAQREPDRARAEVWAVLWRVAHLARRSPRHMAVVVAMDYIEAHLAEPLTVPRIARYADVSHNHLTRLFRAETGDTVVAYIRQRRLARAEHLLKRSTMPIPAIAASVGIPDLQAFNKACRRELGAPPRHLRTS
jgi:AraC-like DNA-binding protein